VPPRFSTWRCHTGERFVRLTDAIALTIALALFVSKGLALSERLLGIRNRPLLIVFAVVWLTSAARRLSEYRLGKYSALGAYANAGKAVPAVIAGIGSWYVLLLTYKLYPGSFIWIPAGLPLWLKVIGIGLAAFAVIRPTAAASVEQPDASTALIPRLTVHAQLLIISMLLISGSLVIVLMVGLWLVILLGLPTNPFSGRPQPQLLCRAVTAIVARELGLRTLSPLKS
jgi:hypothetical protein